MQKAIKDIEKAQRTIIDNQDTFKTTSKEPLKLSVKNFRTTV